MGRLDEKVAVITGATSGIGRACAERFAAESAKVVVAGRRSEVGRSVADKIGPNAFFVNCDVHEEEQIVRLVGSTLQKFGSIDCFISCAGAGSATTTIVDSDPKDLDNDFALHVRAAFLAMKHAAPSMIARGDGVFINISSLSGVCAGFNSFGYEVAKAALTHLTRCAALELGEKGVRVNSISPGQTSTGIFGRDVERDANAKAKLEAAFAEVLVGIQAMPGMAQAKDMAAAALFLASDEARYVNGHDLHVDGGIAAGRPATSRRRTWETLSRSM